MYKTYYLEKFMKGLGITVLAIMGICGFISMMNMGLDKEALVHCAEMQRWADEGRPVNVPHECEALLNKE